MYDTEEPFMGARFPHTELSDSPIGLQVHAGLRFELPDPPLTSPEKLERLKTESVNNPDAILNFLNESEVAKKQYYKDMKAILEKQINIISYQADSLSQQVNVQEDQLAFAKSEAASAKKDALFAKVTSAIAILISIAAIIVPIITG